MVEIWVPYGPVEVSFDIKQENLSQILETEPPKLSQEDLERRLDSVAAESLLLLDSSTATLKALDTLLQRNKAITKILHPKQLGSLARRKAQELGLQVEQLDLEKLEPAGEVEGAPVQLPVQIKNASKLVLLTTVHYDPMFGLTSAASELVGLLPQLKAAAFQEAVEELPCTALNSKASSYAIRALQCNPNLDVIEVMEKPSVGLLNLFYGDIDSVHSQVCDFWGRSMAVNYGSIKAERVIFGCGGQNNDKTLTEALARAFFYVVAHVAMEEDAKVCMLAECSQGLGSEALLRYVTGRFTPGAKLDNVQYFEGLEVLLSFYRLQGRMQLHLLSTLPKYFVERFDFQPITAARDAPSSVIQPGSRSKILVVPDGSSTSFSVEVAEAPASPSAAGTT